MRATCSPESARRVDVALRGRRRRLAVPWLPERPEGTGGDPKAGHMESIAADHGSPCRRELVAKGGAAALIMGICHIEVAVSFTLAYMLAQYEDALVCSVTSLYSRTQSLYTI